MYLWVCTLCYPRSMLQAISVKIWMWRGLRVLNVYMMQSYIIDTKTPIPVWKWCIHLFETWLSFRCSWSLNQWSSVCIKCRPADWDYFQPVDPVHSIVKLFGIYFFYSPVRHGRYANNACGCACAMSVDSTAFRERERDRVCVCIEYMRLSI